MRRTDLTAPVPSTAHDTKVDSEHSSVHSTPSLHDTAPAGLKTDVDSHFRLDADPARPKDEASASAAESPPSFSSHGFSSQYYPEPSAADPYSALVTTACAESLTATAPPGPAPPFEETESSAATASNVVAETKAALPRDTKGGQSSKDLDDGEPPPPYTEGSSPLEGFTYVMAAAGGAASIITQVQQTGPAPINTAIGGGMLIIAPEELGCLTLNRFRGEHYTGATVSLVHKRRTQTAKLIHVPAEPALRSHETSCSLFRNSFSCRYFPMACFPTAI